MRLSKLFSSFDNRSRRISKRLLRASRLLNCQHPAGSHSVQTANLPTLLKNAGSSIQILNLNIATRRRALGRIQGTQQRDAGYYTQTSTHTRKANHRYQVHQKRKMMTKTIRRITMKKMKKLKTMKKSRLENWLQVLNRAEICHQKSPVFFHFKSLEVLFNLKQE